VCIRPTYAIKAGEGMKEESQPFPDFEKPPVVEVVCGVLFKPIDKLLAPHLGQLWDRFKPEYTSCQEVALLAPIIEGSAAQQLRESELTNVPPLPRIWFVHSNESGIIQVQRDRFLQNWRKTRPDDEYPRYLKVYGSFQDHLQKFRQFLNEADLGEIQPLQYEMSYVNHIPLGEGWTKKSEIGEVFPDCSWRSDAVRFLPEFEGFSWRAAFPLPAGSGRLHVKAQHVVRLTDQRPMFLLDLTARGIGVDGSLNGMRSWFDTAREWIVRGFTDLTGPELQKNVWGRRA